MRKLLLSGLFFVFVVGMGFAHQLQKAEVSLVYKRALSTQSTVSGTVVDQAGEGIPGVNVVLKGTSTGTSTDMDGNYSLSIPDDQSNGTLVFSFIGYLSKEEPINGRSVIDVTLEPDIQQLEEVVVVGYGTQRAESVTGAISSVSEEEVAALPVPNVEMAIQGRVPGVNITNTGGPGQPPVVRVRGIGSISFAANPLFVVDGFPIQGVNTGIAGFPDLGLNNFDTEDIQSVDVLKDASSAAVYGSRAANGVIIITTKKGSRDGLRVNLDTYVGVQRPWKQMDLLDREGYIQYATMMKNNAGNPLPSRFSEMNEPIYEGATQTYAQTNTDWQDEMFRTAPISHTHLSLSGGDEKFRVYSSASYFNQEGIMLGTDYSRLSFRLNSEYDISRRFSFGENLTISADDRGNENNTALGQRSQIQHMIRSVPYIPVYDPTLPGGFRAPNGEDGTDPENPVRIALMDRNMTESLRILATGYVNVMLFDPLSYRFTAGIDYVSAQSRTKLPIYNDSFNARNQAQLSDNQFTTISPLFTHQLTFDQRFGRHYLNAVAVAEQQHAEARALQTGGTFNSNDLDELFGAQNQSVAGRRFETHLISYVGRVNYEFANRYLATFSFRRDGSSVFAPGNKWGNFPAGALGWRISEENFMDNVGFISELKLRASYGLLGFNGIGPYDWQIVMNQNASPIIGGSPVSGSYYDRLGNRDLQWETTKMLNVGLDFAAFENSLTFTMEVYNRRVENLILQVPSPPSLGYAQNTTANIGEMRNWGYEFQAGYFLTTPGNFQMNVSANVGIARNEVLQLATPSSTIPAGQFSDFPYDMTNTEEDRAIQSFYGYVTDGIFQTTDEVLNAPVQNLPADLDDYNPETHTAPGDIRFRDLNGDGVINADDRTYLGNFLPDFTYGLNASVNVGSFDVTLFLQGVYGNDLFNLVKWYRQGTPRLFNAGEEVLNAWTPENTGSDIPRMVDSDPNQNGRVSDRFVEDGSYLRIKNLAIGYSLSDDVLLSMTRGVVKNFRIYVSSQNLLTFTRYTGYDPEIGPRPNQLLTSGVDYGQYPAALTIIGGLQIGF